MRVCLALVRTAMYKAVLCFGQFTHKASEGLLGEPLASSWLPVLLVVIYYLVILQGALISLCFPSYTSSFLTFASCAGGRGWHFQALECFVLAHPSTPNPAIQSCWAARSAASPAVTQESPGTLVWSKIDPNPLSSVVAGSQFGPSASLGVLVCTVLLSLQLGSTSQLYPEPAACALA